MIFAPELATLFLLTTAVGYLMLVSGVHKSMLEWRAPRRHCPSCGRTIDGRVCTTCAAA